MPNEDAIAAAEDLTEEQLQAIIDKKKRGKFTAAVAALNDLTVEDAKRAVLQCKHNLRTHIKRAPKD